MNARPYLIEIGEQLKRVGLQAVLIGNAAAALQGAPVTTVDFDFMFRKTARNMQKIRALADRLGATIIRPYYPAADLYRVVRDDGLQIDFMAAIMAYDRSRGCATGRTPSTLAACRSLSRRWPISSGVNARPVGRAIGRSSTSWRRRLKKKTARRTKLEAVRRESERALREMIRRWQALPPGERTNFLRARVGRRGSAL